MAVHVFIAFCLLGAGAAANTGCTSGYSELSLEMMPDKGLGSSTGAVCLDGTDAGFYISKTTNASHANDWQLYFHVSGAEH